MCYLQVIKRADAAAEAILRVCLLRLFLQLSLVQTFASITFVAMIKAGYFSVGLTWLTFSRPGKTLKNDVSETKNPQKSGSFLSLVRLRVWSCDAIRSAHRCEKK